MVVTSFSKVAPNGPGGGGTCAAVTFGKRSLNCLVMAVYASPRTPVLLLQISHTSSSLTSRAIGRSGAACSAGAEEAPGPAHAASAAMDPTAPPSPPHQEYRRRRVIAAAPRTAVLEGNAAAPARFLALPIVATGHPPIAVRFRLHHCRRRPVPYIAVA